MKQAIAVHWFRRDLRLDDNEALKAAVDSGLPVLPIYCQPKELLDSTWLGIGRWGPEKIQFLQESLIDLDRSLRPIGGRVFAFEMSVVEAIDLISEYFDVELITFHSEWAWEEAQEERKLEANLSDSGTSIRKFFGQSLYHPDDVAKVHSEIPDVFGQFRKKLEKQCQVRECVNAIEKIKLPNSIPDSFQGVDCLTSENHKTPRFSGGESMGRERLDYYIWQTGKLGFYKKTRNGLLGDDYSSKFSPWLAWGCLSPRRIYSEVKRFEKAEVKNSSTYWLVFELIWRDFFRFHALKTGRALFYFKGYKDLECPADGKPHLFEHWTNGTTGYPFVDANMRELAQTGFMSNRGRQNVASFLVHDLCLDWRLGAVWFERQLIDYDPYSNYGNWQYVAGIGTDPRPDRYFNILGQASRYDKNAKFVKNWLPELEGLSEVEAQKPWLASKDAVKYHERVVKLKVDA